MYNLEQYEQQYGELFTKQLEIEHGYKKIAEEITAKTYTNVENQADGDDASQTKAGQKFITAQWKPVHDAMETFVDGWLQPKKGSKPSYVALIQEIDSVCGKDDMVDRFTVITFTTMFSSVLKRSFSRSSLAKAIGEELYNEVRLYAFMKQSDYASVVEKGIKKRVGAAYKSAYIRA